MRSEEIDLAQATADAIDAVLPLVHRAGMRLSVNCPPLPALVAIDASAWNKVIIRLLAAAVRSPDDQEIRIQLAPLGSWAMLRITGVCTGQFRASNDEASAPLDVVRYLIEPYGGEACFQSQDDHETCVVVSLPFATPGVDANDRRVTHSSERYFKAMADAAPAILWITEPDGACSFLSRGWYEYTGQNEEQALGFGWLEAVHPDDRESSGRIFREANLRGEPFSLDYRLRCADGQYRWAIDAGKPLHDSTGRFLGYVGSVIDVHQRKLAEEEIRQSVAILEGITKGTRELIAAQDDQYRYIYFNDSYKRTFESLWKTPLVHGVSMLEAMAAWPAELEKAQTLWSRAHAGETFNVVMEFGPSKEDARYFDLHFNPLLD
ncbi:MAG: PAS domain S-box protein, partial [Blastopirellula sp. JB062]